jgi:protoporphyrinogen oxidase
MYDYVIVGGGISGVYLTSLINEKMKGKKVALVEASGRLGGLIETKKFNTGDKKIKYEAGGAVLYSYHKHMLSLVSKYDISVMKIPFDKDNIHKQKFYDCSERKYALGKKTAIKFRDSIEKILKLTRGKSREYLINRTLEQLCMEHLTYSETRELEFLYGYSGEFRESNALTALKALKNELFNSNSMYVFKNGYEEIISKMVDSFKDDVEIMLSSEVKRFKNTKTCKEIYLSNNEVMKSKNIIFALPQKSLLKIDDGFDERERELLESSVKSISLCRVFGKYDVKKNPWISKVKYSSVNNSLRQIIPLRQDEGIVQISYSDWIYADYWGKMPNTTKKTIITKLLKEAMPWERKITEPKTIKTHYWPNAIHFWRQGINSVDVNKELKNIKKGVYICGEAFSLNQGWCEGAVISAYSVFNILQKN